MIVVGTVFITGWDQIRNILHVPFVRVGLKCRRWGPSLILQCHLTRDKMAYRQGLNHFEKLNHHLIWKNYQSQYQTLEWTYKEEYCWQDMEYFHQLIWLCHSSSNNHRGMKTPLSKKVLSINCMELFLKLLKLSVFFSCCSSCLCDSSA